jgi:hypothetical protein
MAVVLQAGGARRTLRCGGARRRLRTLVSNFVHTSSVNERIRGVSCMIPNAIAIARQSVCWRLERPLAFLRSVLHVNARRGKNRHATAATEHSLTYSVPRGNSG